MISTKQSIEKLLWLSILKKFKLVLDIMIWIQFSNKFEGHLSQRLFNRAWAEAWINWVYKKLRIYALVCCKEHVNLPELKSCKIREKVIETRFIISVAANTETINDSFYLEFSIYLFILKPLISLHLYVTHGLAGLCSRQGVAFSLLDRSPQRCVLICYHQAPNWVSPSSPRSELPSAVQGRETRSAQPEGSTARLWTDQ